jgi:hypothetical protein
MHASMKEQDGALAVVDLSFTGREEILRGDPRWRQVRRRNATVVET